MGGMNCKNESNFDIVLASSKPLKAPDEVIMLYLIDMLFLFWTWHDFTSFLIQLITCTRGTIYSFDYEGETTHAASLGRSMSPYDSSAYDKWRIPMLTFSYSRSSHVSSSEF